MKSKTNIFIENANKLHCYKYDYSLTEYFNIRTKVKIICPIHGDFLQYPQHHLNGKNCKKCSIDNNKLTKDVFISKSNEIHNNKYDYSLVNYINNKTKVKIICLEHGIFEQTPNHHISASHICPKCSLKNKFTNKKDFINKALSIHKNKYDYSIIKFTNLLSNIDIICPIHGIFSQKPKDHLKGSGCILCNNSKGENFIHSLLKEKNIIFIQQHKFNDCKLERCLLFDFYLPDYNICIEYQGKQHFEPIKYFGGIEKFEKGCLRDKIKKEYCLNNNITLFIIKYTDDISDSLNIIFKYIQHKNNIVI
ncbi:MAG: Pacmanvirus [Bacteroidota bacterium]|jgi:hypothetical protein